ncbi:MmgE/PrpD family protein [Hyphomicrobium sp. CS1BSMeth3]|uniref:MmgE/PrpD family protein n=1 Tax=Hyphomicrobium sp. CS1BSMeth3 TaxID=1892844 RepID=UPI00093144AD|nr:MmgE/PrpD family protein [Hyphomicrobium sp. CS1BSMeth3]
MGISDGLIEFALATTYADVAPPMRERARSALLDTLGTMIAGRHDPDVLRASSLVADWSTKADARLVTTGRKTALPFAAQINAIAARALDLDDVHEDNTCHVSASLVPSALAIAEARAPVSGKALLTALAVGMEIVCRLSAAPRISYGQTGSSRTYQCPYYATALMAAKLFGLSRDEARHALGIAHARAGGNQHGLVAGASTVKIMQGIAAEGGIIAALMAGAGLSGAPDTFEGKFGYFEFFHRGQYEPSALEDALGEIWQALDASIKPLYPCCRFTHGFAEALSDCLGRNTVGSAEIAGIRATVDNEDIHALITLPHDRKRRPRASADAQYSLPFILASVAVSRKLDQDTIDAANFDAPEILSMIDRVEVILEPRMPTPGKPRFPMPGKVEILTTDGRRIEGCVEYPKGHPRNPLTMDEVTAKFRACAEPQIGRESCDRIVAFVGALEHQNDVSELMELSCPISASEVEFRTGSAVFRGTTPA